MSTSHRLAAWIMAATCAAILALAAWFNPSPDGHGTHRQLGLPPCGMVMALNKPCPTCGMTTAFAHAAHGHFWRSFTTQPAGFIGALATAMAFCLCLYIGLTGSRVGVWCGKLLSPRWLWVAAGVFLAAWAYKWFTWTGAGW